MVTWDDSIQNCQDLSNDTTSASQTFFKRMMNTGYKFVLAGFGRRNIERTWTTTTRAPSSPVAASDRVYQLPPDFNYIKSIKVTVGSMDYPLVEEESQEMWDYRTRINNTGIPAVYFLRPRFGIGGAEVMLDPIPSASGYTLTLVYEPTDVDLSATAVSIGTRLTFTNQSATVSAASATFSNDMIDRYIKTTDGDTLPYRIRAYTSSTSITLENVYHGSTITTTNWSINQMFNLPEEMQILPVYYALWHYYETKKDANQALKYKQYFEDGLAAGKSRWAMQSRRNIIRPKRFLSRWGIYPPNFPFGGVSS